MFEKVDRAILNKKLPKKVYSDAVPPDNEINMVIIGHVDAGKSTLMGHLLCKLGYINNKQVKKNEKMAEEYGKGSFSYAWIMDEDEDERRHGITINTAQCFLKT